MPTAIVIPARYGSSRFPGKPLHMIAGQSLVERVWSQCKKCQKIERIIIATDDERIKNAAEKFGAEVQMTSPDHPSGTDRLAEVAAAHPDIDIWINVQGDEPTIAPQLIDQLAEALRGQKNFHILTAVNPIQTDDKNFESFLHDTNIVKAILTAAAEGEPPDLRRAIFFTRAPAPHRRAASPTLPLYRHLGIYAYRRAALLKFVGLPPSSLETAESLEQLRAIENDIPIHALITAYTSEGIDTAEQAAALEQALQVEN